jgi:SAM-dependent methyltransferase
VLRPHHAHIPRIPSLAAVIHCYASDHRWRRHSPTDSLAVEKKTSRAQAESFDRERAPIVMADTEQGADIASLTPQALAAQLGHPTGDLGVAVAEKLNATNAGAYAAACAKLGAQQGERVLEIGFGNGREIPRALELAPGLTYWGIDVSETMVTTAAQFNAAAIERGQVHLIADTLATSRLAEAMFDRVLAVNTIYFWPEPERDLAHIRRLVRQGGRMVLVAISPSSTKSREIYRHGFRFYEASALEAMLHTVGFGEVGVGVLRETVTTLTGATAEREMLIVAAE